MENFEFKMEGYNDRRKQIRLNNGHRQDQSDGSTHGNTYRHSGSGAVGCVETRDDSNSISIDMSANSLASIIGFESLSKFGVMSEGDMLHSEGREHKKMARHKDTDDDQKMYRNKGQNEPKGKRGRKNFNEADKEKYTVYNEQEETFQIKGHGGTNKGRKHFRETGIDKEDMDEIEHHSERYTKPVTNMCEEHNGTTNMKERPQTRGPLRETDIRDDENYNKLKEIFQNRGYYDETDNIEINQSEIKSKTKHEGDVNQPNKHYKKTDSKLEPFNRISECEKENNHTENSVDTREKQESDALYENSSDTISLPPSVYRNFENPLMAMNYESEFKVPQDNYAKGCKWSPDGYCLLVTSNDSKIRLFNLPPAVQQGKFTCESWFAEEAEKHSVAAVCVQENETIYDYSWYPQMRSDTPSSCCFASTCRDQPVHLWDAWNGGLICSYLSYNHLDEMVAGYSVDFNLDGSRIVVGFSKCIRTFHTRRPGRYFEQIDAKNQPGIISCMSFNPVLTSVFAAGSYLGSIGLYNLEKNNLFCRMDGDIGGVTQVKFSACGTKLFSGSRKNDEILCWDIRNPGTLLCAYSRHVSTSQRIYFDLEPYYNRFLVSGDTNGKVLKWDLAECESNGHEVSNDPSSVFAAHTDCTNGVSIHPFCPILATSSGQRHFPEPAASSPSHSEDEEPKSLFTPSTKPQENTVKLWWLGE